MSTNRQIEKLKKGGVKITIRNLQKKIPIDPKRIRKTILKVLSQEASNNSGEITICFVNDKKIRELNFRFLRKNTPTDVLAFDMRGPKASRQLLADIVISVDTAIRNAGTFKTSALYEINLYVVHGLLHLLGYDDAGERLSHLMRQKEKEYANS